MADKKLEIRVGLEAQEARREAARLKGELAKLGEKVELDFDTSKAQSSARKFFEEIKTGFAREIGANALNTLIGSLEVAKGKVLELGQGVVQTGAKFEDLLATLKTTLGSESAAQAAFAEIQQFAATTPFQVDEVTRAFISLKNRGIEPTNDLLRKSGDLASSQGKSLQQFVEAILDAQTGENERLKEFGIQAKKTGEEVTFTFKGVQKTVAATPEAIAAAVTSFGELQGVLGGMEERSKTFNGQLSNLQDNAERINKTFFDGIKPALGASLELATQVTAEFQKQADGDLPKLKAQAEAFAAELKSNPELAKQLGSALNEASQAISGEILKAAKELSGFLAKNPGYITETIKGLAEMGRQLLGLVDSAIKLADYLGKTGKQIGENFAADNTFTAAGKKLTPQEVGIQATLNPKDIAEFQKRAIDQGEGQSLFYSEEAVRKIAVELNAARAKAAEFGETSKVAFDGLKTGALGATAVVKNQVAEVPKLTEEASKKAIAKLDEANKAAESAVKTAVTNQIAGIKELGLARETEARRIVEVEKNAAIERVAAIQKEIEQVKALRESGKITPEAEQQKLLALNSELATANLARIEKVRAAENALRAELIAGIEEQALKQKVADNDRIASQEKVLNSLKASQELFSAQSGLEAAQDNLAKARLENQLKITEAVGNEKQARSLKLQIQQQEFAAQERSFAAQLKSLEITQQIKAAELERQKILDTIAITESEIALAKLKQKEGVTAGEIALQEQLVALNQKKLAATESAIAQSGQLNDLAKQELLTRQQATRETQATATAVDRYKSGIEGAKAALNGAANNASALADNMQRAAKAAQTISGTTIQQAATAADGIVGSSPGSTVAQQEALAAAQGITNEFEKQAFLFKARARELEKAGLTNTEKVSVGGALLDYKEAGRLFSEAAVQGFAGEFARSVIGQKIAVAQTGQAVSGGTFEEILKNIQELKRDRLVQGFASGTRGQPIRSGIALVGERGPELINVTAQGTHVLSNSESAKFVGGFAGGTGNLKDFIGEALVSLDSAATATLNKKYNYGAGFSATGFNQLYSALDFVRRVQDTAPEIAQLAKNGDVSQAQILSNRVRATAPELKDVGIYKNIVDNFSGALGKLIRPNVYQSDLGFQGSAPNLRVQPQSSGNSSSTSIGAINISAPDPTGAAARFIHLDSVQKMKAAKL